MAALFWAGLAAAPLSAQFADSYAELSLEALMNVTVTSVTKTDVRLLDTAAAVTVLSNEDLRRSGANSVAEALRLVPGMNVGAVNGSLWSISARGFNGLYANKLLVLVDGRAVYSTNYSGVYWDLQQTNLADVDRIEAIRGTGAAVWGANAVNGVVNVLTRSARETQGTLVQAGIGDVERAHFAVRHGGRLGETTFFRVFAAQRERAASPLFGGGVAADAWTGRRAGFRLDHHARADVHFTWQGDVTWSDLQDRDNWNRNLNSLGRWSRTVRPGTTAELQAYIDFSAHEEDVRTNTATADFSAQISSVWGVHHRAIGGAGYRFVRTSAVPRSPLVVVHEPSTERHLVSAFFQNETSLSEDRAILVLGAKLEHHDLVGLEFQPTLRATFKPSYNHAVWAAVSRAVRTPSELEGRRTISIAVGEPFNLPGLGDFLPFFVGDSSVRSEVVQSFELGYRGRPLPGVNFDLALFRHDYSRIIAVSETPSALHYGQPFGRAEFQIGNYHSAESQGGEVAVTLLPTAKSSITASYALLQFTLRGPADTIAWEGSAPRHQSVVRWAYDPTSVWSFDIAWRYNSAINRVPAYSDLDLRIGWRHSRSLEIAFVGQNLLSARHLEASRFGDATLIEIPRGVHVRATVRF